MVGRLVTKNSLSRFILMILLGSLGLSMSCIDQFRIDFEEEDGFLLVEGLITDGRGPSRVKLSRLDTTNLGVDPVLNAQVEIFDDSGNNFELFENSEGEYALAGVDAVLVEVGKAYTLRITTNGKIYESLPEVMQPVPLIDSVYFERFVRTSLTETGATVEKEFLRVKSSFKTLSENSTQLRFDYRGVFNLVTPTPCALGCAAFCFAPDKPSDFLNIFSHEPKTVVQIDESLIDFEVDKRFSIRYILHLRQYSLTPDAYEFWEAINDQRENSGTIFDAQPSVIVSNIRNVNNKKEVVLGFFMASAFTEKVATITFPRLREIGFETDDFYPECEEFPEAICFNCLAFQESSRDSLVADW